MWPIFLRFGSYELGTYGVLVGVAVLVALAVARSLGVRDDLEPRQVNDAGLLTLLAGMVCSMGLGVLVAVGSGHSVTWAELRNAGAVQGGLIGALLSVPLIARRFRLNLGHLLDAFVPAAALGQGLGRLGCFAAGCCFGTQSEGFFAVTYTDPRSAELGGVPLHVLLHPVQLYDAGVHFLAFLVLLHLHKRAFVRGWLVGPWCIIEGVMRLGMESFRGDLGRGFWLNQPWLSTGRMTSLLLILCGLGILTVRAHVTKSAAPRPS